MYYELNVSLNGRHHFATAPRSVTDEDGAKRLYDEFIVKFPADEGYRVDVTKLETTGERLTF
jgi:hypothetical protein